MPATACKVEAERPADKSVEMAITITGKRVDNDDNAYYLHYQENGICWMKLNNKGDARLFLTPLLEGCSIFIFGDPSTPTVSHVNWSEDFNGTVSPFANVKCKRHEAIPALRSKHELMTRIHNDVHGDRDDAFVSISALLRS